MDKTRMQQYMSQMRAMFNKHALYSDESPQYQIPFEPNPGDTVKIRFRTLKNNVDAVYFISGSIRAQMQVGLVRNGFDYYEIEIPVGNEPIRYFFENHVYVTAAETDRYHLGIQVVENAGTGQSLGKIGTGINGFLTAQDLLFHFLVAYQSGHHIQAGIGIHTAA